MKSNKKTITDIKAMRAKNEKIAMLTAYDFYIARLLDMAGIDMILVGDSLGMVFAGYQNTLPVRVDDIFYHASVVSRGAKNALVVADMPFLSYQIDDKSAIENCGRFIKEGVAQAVKIEGGSPEICRKIKMLVDIGIPVMGHIGLTPQMIQTLGGYKIHGRTNDEAKRLIESARRVENAGAFCMVLEAMPNVLGGKITKSVSIPTIGIGAGADCNGQVLVISDVLGMFDEFKPKFARQYADIGQIMRKAIRDYIDDVKHSRFPGEAETYK